MSIQLQTQTAVKEKNSLTPVSSALEDLGVFPGGFPTQLERPSPPPLNNLSR